MGRVFRHLRPVDEYIADHNRHEAEKTADDYADIYETGALHAEVVDAFKDVGNGGEEAEERGKLAGDVKTNERHDWFGEKHVNGSNQGYGDEHLDLLPRRRGGRLREAKSPRLPSFEDGAVRLAATVEFVNEMFVCIKKKGRSELFDGAGGARKMKDCIGALNRDNVFHLI